MIKKFKLAPSFFSVPTRICPRTSGVKERKSLWLPLAGVEPPETTPSATSDALNTAVSTQTIHKSWYLDKT